MKPIDTVRYAMEKLSPGTFEYKFQMVCDQNGRLLGTITDGDIRRGLLRQVTLNDNVTNVMNTSPSTGNFGQDSQNALKLNSLLGKNIFFLPVLDVEGIVREIVISQRSVPKHCALVMAGGFGRRLGTQTSSTPKPLLTVGDRPILDHILACLEKAPVSEIFVAVHYLGDQIEKFVNGRNNRLPVHVIREEEPRGTAGAISMLPNNPETPIMVLNGDLITDVDLTSFIEFHTAHVLDATIAVARHHLNIPFGVIRYGENGQFLGIDEKPTISHFVAAGIYFLAPIFRTLVRPGESLDMPELLERGRLKALRVAIFPIHEYWLDVGRPSDLAMAHGDWASGIRR